MNDKWHDSFMKELYSKLATYTPGNEITDDLLLIRSAFGIEKHPNESVVVQACLFEEREGILQLEIYAVILEKINKESVDNISRYCNVFNHKSICGAMGIDNKEDELFLRDCMFINPSRKTDNIIDEIVIQYEMMMCQISEVYDELLKLNNNL